MTQTTPAPAVTMTSAAAAAGRGSVVRAYRWEIIKLVHQWRTRAVLGACLIGPFLFVIALDQQDRVPKDTLYGRFVHTSGFALALMLLGFCAQWAFPLLTALVAGDIFAAEDGHGTWKTILTRSHGRTHIFTAKVLAAMTFALAVLLALAAATLGAGVLLVGDQPLESVTGTPIAPGHAALLVAAAWGTAALPLLGFTALAVMMSVLTRSAALGIVTPVVIGLLMQLFTFLNGTDTVRHLLLVTPFDSWHGLLATHPFYGPLLHGSWVSVGYIVICLAVAFQVLRRRDITGG
ncbi:MAG TPA: ABC transporter permease [Kineosporiaceae bacterium]